jgi:peptidoglycan hydrolase-like protein with peptidoglycan-binding domain
MNYSRLRPATADRVPAPGLVKALQCFLTEKGLYAGKVTGTYDSATIAAANAWQQAHDFPVGQGWSRANWMSLLIDGRSSVLKYGSAGTAVRRLQRALDAASGSTQLPVTGVFDSATTIALKAWQERVGREVTGVAAGPTWAGLRAGQRSTS